MERHTTPHSSMEIHSANLTIRESLDKAERVALYTLVTMNDDLANTLKQRLHSELGAELTSIKLGLTIWTDLEDKLNDVLRSLRDILRHIDENQSGYLENVVSEFINTLKQMGLKVDYEAYGLSTLHIPQVEKVLTDILKEFIIFSVFDQAESISIAITHISGSHLSIICEYTKNTKGDVKTGLSKILSGLVNKIEIPAVESEIHCSGLHTEFIVNVPLTDLNRPL